MTFPHPHKSGFTLIELIVSVAIFSVVMVVALGGLLSISAGERKAETLKSVMNNLNFALESMSRQIRTGYDYGCSTSGGSPSPGTNCDTAGSRIAFTSSDSGNPLYTYCLGILSGSTYSCNTSANPSTCPAGQVCSILRAKSGAVTEALTPLTSPEVNITSLAFYVKGAPKGSTGDAIQPKVTITLTGTVQLNVSQRTSFNLQTTISQRLYDQ